MILPPYPPNLHHLHCYARCPQCRRPSRPSDMSSRLSVWLAPVHNESGRWLVALICYGYTARPAQIPHSLSARTHVHKETHATHTQSTPDTTSNQCKQSLRIAAVAAAVAEHKMIFLSFRLCIDRYVHMRCVRARVCVAPLKMLIKRCHVTEKWLEMIGTRLPAGGDEGGDHVEGPPVQPSAPQRNTEATTNGNNTNVLCSH